MSLKNRHFLKLLDFTLEEITTYLDLAAELKAAKKAGREVQRMQGKNIALIFEKTSTRTRCAFEVAARDQGAGVTYLEPSASQSGIRKALRIRRVFWGGCLTVSNIAVLDRMWWKSWPSMQACLCSMV